MVRSSEAEANMESTTGFQCTAFTVPECPSSSANKSPLPRCQTYTCIAKFDATVHKMASIHILQWLQMTHTYWHKARPLAALGD